MTHEKMREMLSKDEKITIEYKECVNQRLIEKLIAT